MRLALGFALGAAAASVFSIWTIRGRGMPTMGWGEAATKFFKGCKCNHAATAPGASGPMPYVNLITPEALR